MTQIGQRARDPIVAPTPVLACKADYQRLEFRTDLRAAGIGALPRPVELVRHQPAIPGENGIRLGRPRDILQSFAAESLGDLGQGGSLRIR
jgi:hypothetical protein